MATTSRSAELVDALAQVRAKRVNVNDDVLHKAGAGVSSISFFDECKRSRRVRSAVDTIVNHFTV